MIRDVDLKDISDGKLYQLNDMVRADCGDCKGCSECCHVTSDTIVLDPLDIWNLSIHTGNTFEHMLSHTIELGVTDGIILPHLIVDEKVGCAYLNKEGRCSIHTYRPGLCRIFPLGRIYDKETHSFSYFLQTHECVKENRIKVKVSKWIDVPDLSKNQKYIADWHFFLLELQDKLLVSTDMDAMKKINLLVLKQFFITPYSSEDFYTQFYERLDEIRKDI